MFLFSLFSSLVPPCAMCICLLLFVLHFCVTLLFVCYFIYFDCSFRFGLFVVYVILVVYAFVY